MLGAGTLAAIRTHNHEEVLKYMESLFMGENQIGFLLRGSELEEREIWRLFRKINQSTLQKTVSFVDCSNIQLCRFHSISKIVSFDTHFDIWLTRIY